MSTKTAEQINGPQVGSTYYSALEEIADNVASITEVQKLRTDLATVTRERDMLKERLKSFQCALRRDTDSLANDLAAIIDGKE